jgi:hypothetical protein
VGSAYHFREAAMTETAIADLGESNTVLWVFWSTI